MRDYCPPTATEKGKRKNAKVDIKINLNFITTYFYNYCVIEFLSGQTISDRPNFEYC